MNLPSRIGYLDCFSGVSGDMLLGALLHAGLSESQLRHDLAGLGLQGLMLEVENDTDHGIGCCRIRVDSSHRQDLRTLPAILDILQAANLPPMVRDRAATVFRTLAEAEAKVHNVEIDRIHFHEIGALDTIVDVVGTIAGMHRLGISRLLCSPLPLGRGFVDCAHGRLPLPAPAVCELLRGVPSYGVDLDQELVTPTGAALVKVLADDFGPLPPMTISAVGYGAGSRDFGNDQPNLLRLLLGSSLDVAEAQTVSVLETRLDDWNGEGFPYLCERLLAEGALDVSLTGCMGKKGRPGYLLQVICGPAGVTALQNLLLSETTAIGLRCRREQRRTLPRRIVKVATPWGEVAAKKVETPRGSVIYPEYEVCADIARRHHLALDEVYRAVASAEEAAP